MTERRESPVARPAAVASLVAGTAAITAAGLAFANWSSGSPGPALGISVGFCIFGVLCAWIAEAVGSDRGTLRMGLVGLVLNLLLGAMWFLLFVAASANAR